MFSARKEGSVFVMKMTVYSTRRTNLGIFSIGVDHDLLFKACARGEDANERGLAAAGYSGWNGVADNSEGVQAVQVISLNLL